MIARMLRICAVALAVLTAATGCGSSDRPSELPISDVEDACDLISASDYQQLQVPIEPESLDSVAGVDQEGKSCYYQLRTKSDVNVSAITNHGIDRWTDGRFKDARSKDVARILGFRAITVWYSYDPPTPDNNCILYVDVADGQSLNVEVGESIDEDDPPTCDTARRFAEAAVQTLINRS